MKKPASGREKLSALLFGTVTASTVVTGILLLALALAFVIPALISTFTEGHPVGGVILISLYVFLAVLPPVSARGLSVIASEANKARKALQNGVPYACPKGVLSKNTFKAFAFMWLLSPAFVLLPGTLWMYPVIPGMVVSVVRIVKVYPFYDDLGIPAGRFARWHVLAFTLSFVLFFTVKMLFLP